MAASPMLPINVKFEMPEPAIGKGQACRLHISGDFTFIGEKETTISRLRAAGEAEHGEDAQSSGAGRARIPSAQR